MDNYIQLFYQCLSKSLLQVTGATLRMISVAWIILLAIACTTDTSKKKIQAIPRIEVYNADYQEEGITPLDTGYLLYKVRLFNGKDTICISTNKAGKYFEPHAFTYFSFPNPDSISRTGGIIDFITTNDIMVLPFDSGMYYFEMENLRRQFDSTVFFFFYYEKSCELNKATGGGTLEAPLIEINPQWLHKNIKTD